MSHIEEAHIARRIMAIKKLATVNMDYIRLLLQANLDQNIERTECGYTGTTGLIPYFTANFFNCQNDAVVVIITHICSKK